MKLINALSPLLHLKLTPIIKRNHMGLFEAVSLKHSNRTLSKKSDEKLVHIFNRTMHFNKERKVTLATVQEANKQIGLSVKSLDQMPDCDARRSLSSMLQSFHQTTMKAYATFAPGEVTSAAIREDIRQRLGPLLETGSGFVQLSGLTTLQNPQHSRQASYDSDNSATWSDNSTGAGQR